MIVSRQRVADHGEVFTSPREVNSMLDLVKDETERIDSRFLEPACGHGNFLAEILRRKLRLVTKRYRRSPSSRNALCSGNMVKRDLNRNRESICQFAKSSSCSRM